MRLEIACIDRLLSRMAAQNQHYVPKFVLRQFLSDADNERVTVYDKHSDKTFVTSIKNVMAERRFNDFAFDDDWIASFEPVACCAEDQIQPAYRDVIKHRRLDGTPEQKAALAVFIAFQLLRTKAHRDRWAAIEEETASCPGWWCSSAVVKLTGRAPPTGAVAAGQVHGWPSEIFG